MARAAFTLRLPADERLALEDLSKLEGRPMNQLLNEAVRLYLQRRGPREQTLSESLDRLRRYRERDPKFSDAIAAFAQAEAMLDDDMEGTVIRTRSTPDKAAAGSTQARMQELLRA